MQVADAELIELGRKWQAEIDNWLVPRLEWGRLEAEFDEKEGPAFKRLSEPYPIASGRVNQYYPAPPASYPEYSCDRH